MILSSFGILMGASTSNDKPNILPGPVFGGQVKVILAYLRRFGIDKSILVAYSSHDDIIP